MLLFLPENASKGYCCDWKKSQKYIQECNKAESKRLVCKHFAALREIHYLMHKERTIVMIKKQKMN